MVNIIIEEKTMGKNKIGYVILCVMLFVLMSISVLALQSSVNVNTEQNIVSHQNAVIINGVNLRRDLNITSQSNSQGRNQVTATLNNGEQAQITIMPQTASTNALVMLNMTTCSSNTNCTMQLKSTGSGNSQKIQYEMRVDKNAKLFGLFDTTMQVNAYVDAQTGETRIQRPWWSFMARVTSD